MVRENFLLQPITLWSLQQTFRDCGGGTKAAPSWPQRTSRDGASIMTTTTSQHRDLQEAVPRTNARADQGTANERRWLSLITRMLLPTMLFAMTMLGVVPSSAKAQTAGPVHANAQSKVARDLQAGIALGHTPAVNWARDIHGARYVQVIVVSNSADPELTALRAFVLRTGGSVLARLSGIQALTVLMKAGTVNAMAQRDDVVSVSPNREARQTASTLESITGALTSNVRTNSTKTGYSGWDGTGIGIAVLDSGVMKAHDGFRDGSGVTRVARNVDMFNSAVANWTTGVDTTTSLQPGSSALNTYEAQIAADDDAPPAAPSTTPGARRIPPASHRTRISST
jgi:hypothetical protein